MGDYNPYQPQILGQEWVGIRDEDLFLSPVVNTLETGHGFTLAASRTLADGRFYLHEFPSSDALGQVFQISVYPRGFEAESGPLQRVIIPVNSGGVTGNASFSPGTSVADSLADPSDSKNVTLSGGTPTDAQVDLYFATNSYSAPLSGKRIVAVNFLYSATSSTLSSFSQQLYVLPPATTDGILYGSTTNGSIVAPTAGPGRPEISRIPLGEVSPFWSTTPSNTVERLPWIYTTLQKFEASASGRIAVRLLSTGNASGTAIFYLYAALEVIYCEEQRVAVSGVAFGAPFANSNYGLRQQYVLGTNRMPMRSMSALALNPVLAAGQYSVMLSSPESGATGVESTPYPILNAERQLYEIPTHPGVQVAIPKPAEDHLGDTFTSTVSMVLPQLSLHTSGGTMTEPHAYGRQGAAQVWGAIRAEQEIYDDVVGVNTVYQQVRFYARRFGNTTDTLDFFGIGVMAGVTTPGISPTEWDALEEIVDGWKEVTLRFTSPPTLGTVANPTFRFAAAAEVAGSRWEVLAACAPAISGIPGNLFNQVPTVDRLGAATYQPPVGASVDLIWMPQGVASAYVSSHSADPGCDAVLIFSQDPPTITGVALTQLTQTVTGIGFDCGSLPCCIPSGIGYQRVTWSATSLPTSGFGAYELQRWDTTPGAAFETIMLATNPALTTFNDYEARVGLNSVYRIRALNLYNFAGAWSSQVTGAPPTPGVTGGCSDMTGALIFTSNSDQSGASNAAYVMQWDSDPVEDFGLPEGDSVSFQPMFQRDGAVAFHGTERGLETFSRTLLIQAAAIDPIRLADVKTLRDLAWADLPYICVRDDIGDRWFANVRVPATTARLNRTKYMARVDIVETTTSPAAVDP